MATLILLRHGQSQWNAENRFTGWVDVDLSEAGEAEARHAGLLLSESTIPPVDIVHTSVLTRAVRTANLALEVVGRSYVPVRRHWRLNERHYGGLQGLNKAETAEKHGDEQVKLWRRSYLTPPPPVALDSEYYPGNDPRYADLPTSALPATECLADVVKRMIPYYEDAIFPDLATGATVLVAAHGNSLRALAKHLEDISDDDIINLEIPTGTPRVYEFDDAFTVKNVRYLGEA